MRRLLRWLGHLFEPSRIALLRNAEGIMVDPGEPGENPFARYPDVSEKRWTAAEIAEERQAWHAAHPEEHSEQDCVPCSYANDLIVFIEGR